MAEPKEPLTERELEVLKLLATGASNKEIAAQLFLSPNTIKVHLRNIFTKLEVQTRTEATLVAVRNGWVALAEAANDTPTRPINADIDQGPDHWDSNALPSTTPPQDPTTQPIPTLTESAADTAAVSDSNSDSDDPNKTRPITIAEQAPRNIEEAVVSEATVAARKTPTSIDPIAPLTPVPVAPNPQLLPPLSLRRRALLVGAGLLTLVFMVIALRPQPTLTATDENLSAGGPIMVAMPQSTHWVARSTVRTARTGSVAVTAEGRVYVIGGQTDTGLSDEVLLYTPRQNTWEDVNAPKPTPVFGAGGAAIGKRVYVLGGIAANGQPSRQFEMLDLAGSTWTALSDLPTAISGHAVSAAQNKLYVFGGRVNGEISAAARVFDPGTETWADLPPMPTPRTQAAAAVINDSIYVVGGSDGQQELTTCEVFSIRNNRWQSCSPMTTARSSFGLAAVGQSLYAIGGGVRDFVGFNEKYNINEDKWSNFDTPPARVGDWRNIAVVSLPTEFYVIGGSTRGVTSADNYVYEVFTMQIGLPSIQK